MKTSQIHWRSSICRIMLLSRCGSWIPTSPAIFSTASILFAQPLERLVAHQFGDFLLYGKRILRRESNQERYSNSTYGFLGKAITNLPSPRTVPLHRMSPLLYISNLISGSLTTTIYSNFQYRCKNALEPQGSNQLWREDLFSIPTTGGGLRYLNQDNSYFAMPESRFFYVGFQYNLGNYTLRENKNTIKTVEGDRLQ